MYAQRYVERPRWRADGLPATSSMVKQISDYIQRYEALDDSEKAWAKDVYAQKQGMAEFLFQVNKIEGEGFDTLEETQEAVSQLLQKDALEDHPENDENMEQVRCLHRALSVWWEKEGAAAPTVNNYKLLKSHDVLMASTKPGIAGMFRSSSELASTITSRGTLHYYTSPSAIKIKLSNLVSKTNSEVQRIFAVGPDLDMKKVEQLLVAGTDFFYKFECIHPFVDGNGRCGRIMLAYLLRSVCFFPNVLFTGGEFVDRNVYLECFEDAREVDDNEPRDLTSLVIEGVYFGWQMFFAALEARKASTLVDDY